MLAQTPRMFPLMQIDSLVHRRSVVTELPRFCFIQAFRHSLPSVVAGRAEVRLRRLTEILSVYILKCLLEGRTFIRPCQPLLIFISFLVNGKFSRVEVHAHRFAVPELATLHKLISLE